MITDWHNVESSNVQSIAFDEETKEIIVLFKSGSCYAYDVARSVFDNFVRAESKGQFVHKVFRAGGMKFRRLDGGGNDTETRVESS